MRKLGAVTIITKKGDLLVQAKKAQKIGSTVVNKEIKLVGTIVDVIGPAHSPYIVINTRNAEKQAKKGQLLYVVERPTKKTKSPSRKRASGKEP